MHGPVTDKHLGAEPMQFKEGQSWASIMKRFLWLPRAPSQYKGMYQKLKVSGGRTLLHFQIKVKKCYFVLCVLVKLCLLQCRDLETQTSLIKQAIKLVCYDKCFITFFQRYLNQWLRIILCRTSLAKKLQMHEVNL